MLQLRRWSENWLKVGVLQVGAPVSAKFSRSRGRPPRTVFARIDKPVNALQLCRWQYSHKETLWQTFFKWTAITVWKRRFAFLSPSLGAYKGNVRCSYRGYHPAPFLPVQPRFSNILCQFAHNFFPSDVTPLEGVTPSDATSSYQ